VIRSVPFLDLKSPHRELADEILAKWRQILEGAAFVGGPEVEAFEQEFAEFAGTEHCVGVSSGTDALRLALQAMGVGPGDEVITVPNTFIATTEAITQVGAKPVFVDVEADSATMDPADLEAAITSRTKALVPVHLYGQAADMTPILDIANRHGLLILEDAAQAHGALYHGRPVGGLGHAAAFSFYPGKNLGACGEAGAVTTSDPDLAHRVRVLRDHGQPEKYIHSVEGWNARLDALQAAALRIKLRHLGDWTRARRAAAEDYGQCLEGSGVQIPSELSGRKHVYHLYVVRHPERNRLRQALDAEGIASGLHYPIPLHLQEAYARLGHRRGDFPRAELWASEGFSLPMFPGLSRGQIEHIAEAVKVALGVPTGELVSR